MKSVQEVVPLFNCSLRFSWSRWPDKKSIGPYLRSKIGRHATANSRGGANTNKVHSILIWWHGLVNKCVHALLGLQIRDHSQSLIGQNVFVKFVECSSVEWPVISVIQWRTSAGKVQGIVFKCVYLKVINLRLTDNENLCRVAFQSFIRSL